jgi:hypothetical protein
LAQVRKVIGISPFKLYPRVPISGRPDYILRMMILI